MTELWDVMEPNNGYREFAIGRQLQYARMDAYGVAIHEHSEYGKCIEGG